MHKMPVHREFELVGKVLDFITVFGMFIFLLLNWLEGYLSLYKQRARARKGTCPLLMHKSCNDMDKNIYVVT